MDRGKLIRLAFKLSPGDPRRVKALKTIMETRVASHTRQAFSEETASFVDWVITNKDPISESAASSWVERFLGRDPSPYEKKEKPRSSAALSRTVREVGAPESSTVDRTIAFGSLTPASLA